MYLGVARGALQVTLSRTHYSEVFDALRAKGIGVQVHYIPVYTQPYYQRFNYQNGSFPETEKYYAEALSLPLYPGLKEEEQNFVMQSLKEVLQ